jgi:beta-lactamase class C
MVRAKFQCIAIVLLCSCLPPAGIGHAAADQNTRLHRLVTQAITPLMQRYGVPGMAVGIIINSHSYCYDYGVASRATGKPVSRDTLFEIGSISKTFTATLASYAQVTGQLALSDTPGKYLPALRGSSFDHVSVLNLATHTSGGLPLQVPDEISNDAQLMAYYQNWKPAYAAGTYRTYSNPGIGMLGLVAAKSMHQQFDTLMERTLFPGLGLKHTYLQLPKAQADNYAQGYTMTDVPVRMTPGVLASEAYGIRTTAADLLRFIAANMQLLDLDRKLQAALVDTHTGYYRIGAMTQDLVWEQYRYPAELDELLAGNSAGIIFDANPVTGLSPPLPPQADVLINKTGSTNGFGAYMAFVPGKKIGVVLLANKSYPIEARVSAAFEILTQLDGGALRDSR